jgi:c-di-GMP-binding flagellar brake protein YcgR
MEERRQCGRWQVKKTASVRFKGLAYPFECQVRDIGYKGIRIHSPRALTKDSNLALSIALDPGLSLNIEEASVVWSNPEGQDNVCGLCFTEIREKEKEKIQRFVQSNFREQIKQHVWEGLS